MGRPIWCRFCAEQATVIAGVFPEKCARCEGVGFWSTQPVSLPFQERRRAKRPRVPFDLTDQDYRLFLKRIGVSKN